MDLIAQKRDENEQEIIDAAQRVGSYVVQQDKAAGFDLLIIHPHGNFVVEVKNPAKRWALTPNEEKTKQAIERVGGRYSIVETIQDILDLLEY